MRKACDMACDMESYFTMRGGLEAQGEFVDRKSCFIAQLVHVEDEHEAAAHIEEVRSRHFDARHNVPAWILRDGQERASDDGEPQRTSGMPTLEVLRGARLKDVCCVTTRYFGGTLLGPGGLVRAYTAAAQAAIEMARIQDMLVEMTAVAPVGVRVPYALLEQARHLVEQAGGKERAVEYTDEVALSLVFHAGDEGPFIAAMTELTAGNPRIERGAVRFDEF